jgi:DNA-binding NtrC family response regulator
MVHLLLVDDDPDATSKLVRHTFRAEHRVEVVRTGAEGLARLAADPPDVLLLNSELPDRPGLEVLDTIRGADSRVPVVFLAHSTSADEAIEAMKRGAFDHLFKPLVPAQLHQVVDEALETSRRVREADVRPMAVPEEETSGTIIGACPAMREVYKSVGRVAARDVPVLVTGESGTGKELVARAIHQHSRRCQAPFVALNCAAIPENLLESELFGHEKGAFTGADRKRIGRFEQCHGGTLFLDEIGDMPPALQAKMLRVLQEQRFERVGGSETVTTDVRVISATHRDLKALAGSGDYRADLYYRLGVFTIHLPPLRDRGDDLPLLIRHFLRQFSRELERDARDLSREALDRLVQYSWPGNLRELQSVLKQALLRSNGPVLLPSMLPELAPMPPASDDDAEQAACRSELNEFIQQRLADGSEALYEETRWELDRVLLPLVMDHTRGNLFRAAKVLGVARQTLRRRLRDLKITARFAGAENDEPERHERTAVLAH